MDSQIYDDLALEQNAKAQFGVVFDVDHVVARNLPVSRTAVATVFLTKKKQLMAYVSGPSKLQLGDVSKIISRMGMTAELYFPPKGQPNYFDDIGRGKFLATFPGSHEPSSDDIRYYRTLAPYNPALVQIQEVKTGEIFQYDADSRSGWRPAAKFAYRRIRTS